jgi:hypothetical protein
MQPREILENRNSLPIRADGGFTTDRITALNANGFSLGTSTEVNTNGTTYVYIAVADNGAGILKVGSYTGNGSDGNAITGVGFQPGYVLIKSEATIVGASKYAGQTNSSMQFGGGDRTDLITSLDANGFTVNNGSASGGDLVNIGTIVHHYFAFKEVAGIVDVFSYTGNGTDDRNIATPNFQPDFVLIKGDTAAIPAFRTSAHSGDNSQGWDSAQAANGIQSLTSTGFQVGTSASVNSNAVTYYALAVRGNLVANATLDQEGFRWRADDGSETGASWLASQDTNISRNKETATRLRVLVDVLHDTPSAQYLLAYYHNGEASYRGIPTSVTYSEVVNEPCVNTPSTGSLTGDAVFDNTNDYIQLNTVTNFVSGRYLHSGTLASSFTTEFDMWAGGGNGADAIWFFFGNTSEPTQEDSASGGYAVAFSEYHDAIRLYWNGSQVDTYTYNNLDNSTWRSVKINASVTGSGSEFQIFIDGDEEVTLTDSTARTVSGTNYGWAGRTGGLNNEHRVRNILLYTGFQERVVLKASSNITASGANTTAQLTAPSGKTTSDFTAGRIQDDENPTDATD